MKMNKGSNRFDTRGVHVLFTGQDGVREFFSWLDKHYAGFFDGVPVKKKNDLYRTLAKGLNQTKQSQVMRRSNVTDGAGW